MRESPKKQNTRLVIAHEEDFWIKMHLAKTSTTVNAKIIRWGLDEQPGLNYESPWWIGNRWLGSGELTGGGSGELNGWMIKERDTPASKQTDRHGNKGGETQENTGKPRNRPPGAVGVVICHALIMHEIKYGPSLDSNLLKQHAHTFHLAVCWL